MDDRQVSGADVRLIEREESLVTEVQYLIQGLMNERGLNRAELALMLGTTKARVTQLLSDNANPTLRTLAKVFDALDEEICISRVKQVAAKKCADEGEDRAWKSEKAIATAPVEATAQVTPNIWKALLELEATNWQITSDPVSNDNWGALDDGEMVAYG